MLLPNRFHFCRELRKRLRLTRQAAWRFAAKRFTRATTQIYTHVMQKPGIGVRSPLDG